MARVWKLLRSRFFLGAVCIVLEFVQLLTVYMLLYRLFHPLTIAAWVFSIGVLLYLINKDESAETKIPWLMILLLLPVMGAFVYMLLSSNETSRKQYERFAENGREILPFLPQTEDVEHLAGNDADALSQIRYIYSAAKMPCHGTSATAYFPSGEAFLPALLDDLRAAERFILLEYFIIQEGRMWNAVHEILRQKAAEGVKVCLMYDDFGCIATLPDNYDRQLRAEGISCTVSNRFRPILSHIHNNRDHRKITVIDGRVGYTGGLNLADEYINAVEKHGHWKDTAVRVEGAAARNLTALFLSVWNAQSEDKLDAAACLGESVSCPAAGGCVVPFGDGPAPIYREEVGRKVYLNIIHGARDYLYITTPYLVCDRELLGALRLAARKGVDVRLITPHIPDKKLVFLMTRSNYAALLDDGVKIYEYTPGFIHAKNFVCDDRFAVCGTINLDYRSLVHHFECGVWMYRADCIPDLKADFLATQELSHPVAMEEARLRGLASLSASVLKVFSPLL